MSPKEIITALQDGGSTELEIARATGTSQATINRIKRGSISKPNYEIVAALIGFYEEKKAASSTERAA